jgi:ribosomal protein L24E
MSYTVDGDGKVTFRCQGKDCGKMKEARSLKVLPKGWCISSILLSEVDAEFKEEGDPKTDMERVQSANAELAGHFCSFKCAKRTFADPRIIACVKKYRVAVVVYGQCKLVIDAENLGGEDGGRPAPRKGGSRDDEPTSGDTKPRGLDKPNSPPPFQLPESAGGGV